MKKLAVILADEIYPQLIHHGGSLSDVFTNYFSDIAGEVQCFEAREQCYPTDITEFDGFVITGSRHSVYEDLHWIHTLHDMVQKIHSEQKKLLGICFGHQVIASALGGQVQKSDNGWGVGVRQINVKQLADWMDPQHQQLNMVFNHQDQVVELPPGAEVLAHDEHCPVQMFQLDNHVLGMQFHPEYTVDYQQDLMDILREKINEDAYDTAKQRRNWGTHQDVVKQWIRDFLVS